MAADWILGMLTQEITVEGGAPSALNAYGDPAYSGAQRKLAARVSAKAQLIRGPDGETVASDTTIHLAPDCGVDLATRIWLPGADTSSSAAARRPLAVSSQPDLEGDAALVVVFL